MTEIHLGYEVPTGKPVSIPLHHLVVTGLTRLSGKTTTIEALLSRSGKRSIVFLTKRGELPFTSAHKMQPFFRERSDWRYVRSLLESAMRERLKFEQYWIIRASKGTRNLQEVQANVKRFLADKRLRGVDQSVFTSLDAYLDLVIPQLQRTPFTDKLELQEGLNVMDLTQLSPEVKMMVIASVLEEIMRNMTNIIGVVPEAWMCLPQARMTPVKYPAEAFYRQGAVLENYLWLDSQDLAGVDKNPLKSIDVWLLGRQRERNEVEHTLDQIPLPKNLKPKPEAIMQLEVGHFYACFGDEVHHVYVQPDWMISESAREIAKGNIPVDTMVPPTVHTIEGNGGEEAIYKEKYEELQSKFEEAEKTNQNLSGLLENADLITKDLLQQNQALEEKARVYGRLALAVGEVVDLQLKNRPEAVDASGQLQLNITATETTVNIQHAERTEAITTEGLRGQILYVVAGDHKGGPVSRMEIMKSCAEHGWTAHHTTFDARLSELTGEGLLIREDSTSGSKYRLPGKVHFTIPGAKT